MTVKINFVKLRDNVTAIVERIYKERLTNHFVCLQTNIPFLKNVLQQEDFLGGAVTTDFILQRPELFKVERGQNRAQKLLQYLGNVMVNGPCTPLATGLKPSKDAPEPPEVCF